MALFAAEGKKEGAVVRPASRRKKAWECRKFEHLRWSFPEAYESAKRVFQKREEWRSLEEPSEEEQMQKLAMKPSPKHEGKEAFSVGARLARAFGRREQIEVARLKYLGTGDDGGKGRALFESMPITFENTGSVVPQRALRVRQKPEVFPEDEDGLTLEERTAKREADILERENYLKDRKKLRLITAQRHTSRNRKPNGGFYSSDTVAGKIWEYYDGFYNK